MADAVTVDALENGFQNVVLRLTNLSDGTGESVVKKYDATSTGSYGVSVGGQTFYPGIHTTIMRIEHTLGDMKVQLLWEATANKTIEILTYGGFDFRWTGGLRVPAGLAGATGSILLTTLQNMPLSSYSIMLWLRKNIQQ